MGIADDGKQSKGERVRFDHRHAVRIIGIDGTWRRSCILLDASASGAKLEVEGSFVPLKAREFFLALSSTGSAKGKTSSEKPLVGSQ